MNPADDAQPQGKSASGLPDIAPDALKGMAAAFMESRALLTAVELDLFTAVGPNGGTAAEVSARATTDGRATEMLLNVLVAFGLLNKGTGERYTLGETATDCLVAGAPDDARDALMHTVHLWPRWGGLTDCVRRGGPVEVSRIPERDEDWVRSFIAAMHRNASAHAPQVAKLLELEGAKRVLDLGGGSGAYAIAFARANPQLIVTVFDLPAVTPLTTDYVAQVGLQERISIRAGDMLTDDLGDGYDLAWGAAICHMFSPEQNLKLFGRVLEALRPGGRIALSDFVLNDQKTAPRFGALFALNMLVNTQRGNSYSRAEYFQWLTDAGFAAPRLVELPGPADLIVAEKAADSG